MPKVLAHQLDWRGYLFAASFALALLFGGGGAEGPFQNGLISAVGALLLGIIAADHLSGARPLQLSASLPLVIMGLLLIIPLLQLVPLPASIWQSLPGRELVVSGLQQIGAQPLPRPLSIDPRATAAWTASLLMPSALFLYVAQQPLERLRLFIVVLIGAGLVSGLVGALQLSLGHPDALTFFDGPSQGAASGVFANPNHQGLFMVLALIACAALAARGSNRSTSSTAAWSWAGIAFFSVMAVASGSRAALALLALALLPILAMQIGSGSILRWSAGVAALAVLFWIVVILYPGTNTLALRESFAVTEDGRAAFYPDLILTLSQYWTAGSGLGTFTTAFMPNENLDLAIRAYLNHAHNDLIEFLIEAGAPGAVVLVIGLGSLAWRAIRHLPQAGPNSGLLVGVVLLAVLILLHSLGDYPLRTSSIAAVFAVAAGIIFSRPAGPAGRKDPSPTRPVRLWPYIALTAAVLPIAAQAARLGTIEWSLREGRYAVAAQLGSRAAPVLVAQANSKLSSKEAGLGETLATEAVFRDPMNPAALRTLAVAREAQSKLAAPTWQAATLLGWRDSATQIWAFRQGLANNEPEVAAIRADAFLRTGEPSPEMLKALRVAAKGPTFRKHLVERLKLDPAWSRSFFEIASTSSADETDGVEAVVKDRGRDGAAFSINDAGPLIATLISRREYKRALTIHRRSSAAPSAGNLIADASFDREPKAYRTGSTMFDWRLLSGRSTAGTVERGPPSVLILETDGERSETAADVHLPLPAGRYELRYRFRSDEAEAGLLRLTCLDGGATLAEVTLPSADVLVARTTVLRSAQNCPLARLSVLSTVSGRPATVEFDEIALNWTTGA